MAKARARPNKRLIRLAFDAKKFRRLRGARSQLRIAELAGVNRSQVSRWETGITEPTGAAVATLLMNTSASILDLYSRDRERT